MISCKQSTEWVIQKDHGRLSIKQNLQLMSHLAICSFCRLFVKQSSLIDKALFKSRNIEVSTLAASEKEELLLSVMNKTKY